jgi:hypothetical protein
MLLACLIWAAFVFFYYRSILTRYIRHNQYAEYANAVFSAVGENFSELKGKSTSLVADLGYNRSDDSAWKEEVEKFVTMIVLPKLKDNTRAKFRTSPEMIKEFSTLSYNFVLDLVSYASMPTKYDLKELIASIESTGDARSLVSGRPVFKPGKEILSKLALLVLAAGTLSITEPSIAADGQAFSPMDACNALGDEEGFTPSNSGYSELSEGVYSCGTPYKDMSGGALPNNLSMYGKGSPDKVTRVRIMLNVNEKANAKRDTKELGRLCQKMIKTLAGSAPVGLAEKVASGIPFTVQHEGYRVYLEKTVWPTGKGFELNCGIATSSHKE